jgi:xanthine dehydrogenase accessory factor
MAFFARLAELERESVPFALATVVARRSPVSSHLGDHALVLANGTMDGFVGGACSRDIVRREALRAIGSGRPRLLRIRPSDDSGERSNDDAIDVPMGCASGGSVEVYIEPHVPLRRLIVVGDTGVADALARVAAQVPYDVVRVVAAGELDALDAVAGVHPIALGALVDFLEAERRAGRRGLIAVVASQGHYDEETLEALLAAEPAFVGLVASRRRGADIAAALERRGVDPDRVAAVRAPAGLDLGARTPGEVAISIVAEIVEATAAQRASSEPIETTVRVGVDPVCGMEVELETARYRSEHDGRTYVFCCAGCRDAFVPA